MEQQNYKETTTEKPSASEESNHTENDQIRLPPNNDDLTMNTNTSYKRKEKS